MVFFPEKHTLIDVLKRLKTYYINIPCIMIIVLQFLTGVTWQDREVPFFTHAYCVLFVWARSMRIFHKEYFFRVFSKKLLQNEWQCSILWAQRWSRWQEAKFWIVYQGKYFAYLIFVFLVTERVRLMLPPCGAWTLQYTTYREVQVMKLCTVRNDHCHSDQISSLLKV